MILQPSIGRSVLVWLGPTIASVLDWQSQEVRRFGFGIRLFQAGRFGSSI